MSIFVLQTALRCVGLAFIWTFWIRKRERLCILFEVYIWVVQALLHVDTGWAGIGKALQGLEMAFGMDGRLRHEKHNSGFLLLLD
jgi:hypothetical protein